MDSQIEPYDQPNTTSERKNYVFMKVVGDDGGFENIVMTKELVQMLINHPKSENGKSDYSGLRSSAIQQANLAWAGPRDANNKLDTETTDTSKLYDTKKGVESNNTHRSDMKSRKVSTVNAEGRSDVNNGQDEMGEDAVKRQTFQRSGEDGNSSTGSELTSEKSVDRIKPHPGREGYHHCEISSAQQADQHQIEEKKACRKIDIVVQRRSSLRSLSPTTKDRAKHNLDLLMHAVTTTAASSLQETAKSSPHEAKVPSKHMSASEVTLQTTEDKGNVLTVPQYVDMSSKKRKAEVDVLHSNTVDLTKSENHIGQGLEQGNDEVVSLESENSNQGNVCPVSFQQCSRKESAQNYTGQGLEQRNDGVVSPEAEKPNQGNIYPLSLQQCSGKESAQIAQHRRDWDPQESDAITALLTLGNSQPIEHCTPFVSKTSMPKEGFTPAVSEISSTLVSESIRNTVNPSLGLITSACLPQSAFYAATKVNSHTVRPGKVGSEAAWEGKVSSQSKAATGGKLSGSSSKDVSFVSEKDLSVTGKHKRATDTNQASFAASDEVPQKKSKTVTHLEHCLLRLKENSEGKTTAESKKYGQERILCSCKMSHKLGASGNTNGSVMDSSTNCSAQWQSKSLRSNSQRKRLRAEGTRLGQKMGDDGEMDSGTCHCSDLCHAPDPRPCHAIGLMGSEICLCARNKYATVEKESLNVDEKDENNMGKGVLNSNTSTSIDDPPIGDWEVVYQWSDTENGGPKLIKRNKFVSIGEEEKSSQVGEDKNQNILNQAENSFNVSDESYIIDTGMADHCVSNRVEFNSKGSQVLMSDDVDLDRDPSYSRPKEHLVKDLSKNHSSVASEPPIVKQRFDVFGKGYKPMGMRENLREANMTQIIHTDGCEDQPPMINQPSGHLGKPNDFALSKASALSKDINSNHRLGSVICLPSDQGKITSLEQLRSKADTEKRTHTHEQLRNVSGKLVSVCGEHDKPKPTREQVTCKPTGHGQTFYSDRCEGETHKPSPQINMIEKEVVTRELHQSREETSAQGSLCSTPASCASSRTWTWDVLARDPTTQELDFIPVATAAHVPLFGCGQTSPACGYVSEQTSELEETRYSEDSMLPLDLSKKSAYRTEENNDKITSLQVNKEAAAHTTCKHPSKHVADTFLDVSQGSPKPQTERSDTSLVSSSSHQNVSREETCHSNTMQHRLSINSNNSSTIIYPSSFRTFSELTSSRFHKSMLPVTSLSCHDGSEMTDMSPLSSQSIFNMPFNSSASCESVSLMSPMHLLPNKNISEKSPMSLPSRESVTTSVMLHGLSERWPGIVPSPLSSPAMSHVSSLSLSPSKQNFTDISSNLTSQCKSSQAIDFSSGSLQNKLLTSDLRSASPKSHEEMHDGPPVLTRRCSLEEKPTLSDSGEVRHRQRLASQDDQPPHLEPYNINDVESSHIDSSRPCSVPISSCFDGSVPKNPIDVNRIHLTDSLHEKSVIRVMKFRAPDGSSREREYSIKESPYSQVTNQAILDCFNAGATKVYLVVKSQEKDEQNPAEQQVTVSRDEPEYNDQHRQQISQQYNPLTKFSKDFSAKEIKNERIKYFVEYVVDTEEKHSMENGPSQHDKSSESLEREKDSSSCLVATKDNDSCNGTATGITFVGNRDLPRKRTGEPSCPVTYLNISDSTNPTPAGESESTLALSENKPDLPSISTTNSSVTHPSHHMSSKSSNSLSISQPSVNNHQSTMTPNTSRTPKMTDLIPESDIKLENSNVYTEFPTTTHQPVMDSLPSPVLCTADIKEDIDHVPVTTQLSYCHASLQKSHSPQSFTSSLSSHLRNTRSRLRESKCASDLNPSFRHKRIMSLRSERVFETHTSKRLKSYNLRARTDKQNLTTTQSKKANKRGSHMKRKGHKSHQSPSRAGKAECLKRRPDQWSSYEIKSWLNDHNLNHFSPVFETRGGENLMKLKRLQMVRPREFFEHMKSLNVPFLDIIKFSRFLRQLVD